MSRPNSSPHRHLSFTRSQQPGWLIVTACLLACLEVPAPAADSGSTSALVSLSIEQLMNESVTSVSKKEVGLDVSPAAISVITAEDIRRLGFTSIPEALRLAPGMDVARIDSNHWAISGRGFNSQYANDLLVLMDGRSVYTPTFNGVYWGNQDMMLEDLDRIEVIRGPGASLWGANAVNGVVNVTSKNSKDTQGWLFSSTAGTEDQPSISLRYGGEITPQLHYRAYAKYFNRDEFSDSFDGHAPGYWDSIRTGFRTDWEPSSEDLVTLQGDLYSFHVGEVITVPTFVPPFSETSDKGQISNGGNVLARWTRKFSEESHFLLQAYFDAYRNGNATTVERRRTADIQLEHRFPLWSWNDIQWGLGYRFTTDSIANSPVAVWDPQARDLNLYTGFVQDEITLIPRRLRLTLGSKFEHNDYTGWEIQPSGRLIWTPTEHQSIWASVSHAVSTPSRVSREARINTQVFQASPLNPIVETSLTASSNTISERLNAYELGYRVEPGRNLSFDLATFYHDYDRINGLTTGFPQLESDPTPHLLIPLSWNNDVSGHSYGVELSVQWKPIDRWRLVANYTWLRMHVVPDNTTSKENPQQQVSLQSYLTLPWNLEFNSFISYVDRVQTATITGTTPIPAYLRVDAGLVWHASKTMEFGVWGQNLLDPRHAESSSQNTSTITEIPRSIVAKFTWRF